MAGTDGLHVDYRKWPDRGHWQFMVYPLGADAHGRWFYLPEGARVQRGSEPPLKFPRTSAMLLQEGAWWSAMWNSDTKKSHELYIDVATPARWCSDRVTMIDLDLDVVRTWDGKVEIIDRDEFALHQKIMNYPREVIETAERTAETLVDLVTKREEPFGDVGKAWLQEAISRSNRRQARAS